MNNSWILWRKRIYSWNQFTNILRFFLSIICEIRPFFFYDYCLWLEFRIYHFIKQFAIYSLFLIIFDILELFLKIFCRWLKLPRFSFLCLWRRCKILKQMSSLWFWYFALFNCFFLIVVEYTLHNTIIITNFKCKVQLYWTYSYCTAITSVHQWMTQL